MTESELEQEYLSGKRPCPVEVALNIIGGKWKGVILYKLLKEECLRFGELKRRMPRVTQRMLTMQLRGLEEDGLVNRKIYPEIPPRVEYRLTPLGKSLEPVIKMLMEWGIHYEISSENLNSEADSEENENENESEKELG
ncbi:helix-turn-helix transcriptional regulator [Sansalvadorimonas sp. 2012CJ34-2]|uniref:Helix-turn-helix transcriptional regulator n=1 Tax=Parendozoicomonas callyspongiae TaxID=2942213 RepID=A0ABT0PBE0_9GAMM|nr:helix-turn-helix domain-containing protein [Sansalvadorimonas sp. 2012CJ34-2]MCL6268699.1 helix-turn-helix transcriptional regulator [Sansalvadorimonas sp. 2012CJ34-2]